VRTSTKKILRGVAITFAVAVVAIQLVPYGRDHTNPPRVVEPTWDRPETRELAVRACFDCHSNETAWPWYAHVAPTSWLVQSDVDEGRRVLNFSDWSRGYEEAAEAAEVVLENEMPPRSYTILHPEARLSPHEKRELAAGLNATLGGKWRRFDVD
jgi:hypothetical protein